MEGYKNNAGSCIRGQQYTRAPIRPRHQPSRCQSDAVPKQAVEQGVSQAVSAPPLPTIPVRMPPRTPFNLANTDANTPSMRKRQRVSSNRPLPPQRQQQQQQQQRQQHYPLPHRQHRQHNNGYPWAVCCKLGMAVVLSSMFLVAVALVLTSPSVLAWIQTHVMQHMTHILSPASTVSSPSTMPPRNLLAIWHEPHDTQSGVITPENTDASVLWDIFMSLKYHLQHAQGRIPCLCMHHLDQSVQPYRRACAVYNGVYERHDVYFMVNPHPVGRSKENVVKTEEKSISCPRIAPVQMRERFEHVFIEWRDEKGTLLLSRFKGRVGVCMQLAMEEFLGDTHCPHIK